MHFLLMDCLENEGGPDISESLLDEVMKTVKQTTTKDPYGMDTKTIKNVYSSIKEQLLKIIQRSLDEAKVPDNMRNIWITPIPKKGKAPCDQLTTTTQYYQKPRLVNII